MKVVRGSGGQGARMTEYHLSHTASQTKENYALNCLIVGACGCIGAILRYLISSIDLGPQGSLGGFPIKTFIINVLGAFVIGLVVAAAARGGLDERWTTFLKVGVCGGFTTFSSFALETDQLLGKGAPGMAVLYVCLSVVCGVAAVVLGQRVAA